MNRYLLSFLLSMIFGAPLGNTPVQAQPTPQTLVDFCAPFVPLPCQNQAVYQQGAIAAIDIRYPQKADSNVQIFETPDLARRMFDQERSAGDLDILGRLEATGEVGDNGYGYKRTGSPEQKNALLVEYDFVRACYLVILNNADSAISNADGSVEYSRESNQFAIRFAQQLDETLKGVPCRSTTRLANGGASILRKMSGAVSVFSLPVTEGEAIGGGAVIIGLGLLLSSKPWMRHLDARTVTAYAETANATPVASIPSEPAAPYMQSGALAEVAAPAQLNVPYSIDEPTPVGARPTTTRDRLMLASRLRSHKLFATLTMVSLFIIGGFGLAMWNSAHFSVDSKSSSESHLGLQLERKGSDWRLTWNPDAPVISKATKGRLLITDGALHKSIDLDSFDLRSGIILYTPVSNDIVLRLDVGQSDSTAVVSEAIRVTGAPSVSAASQTLKLASNYEQPNTTSANSATGSPSDGRRASLLPDVPKPTGGGSKIAKPAQTNEANALGTSEEPLRGSKFPMTASAIPIKSPSAAPPRTVPPISEADLTSSLVPFELPPSVTSAEVIKQTGHLQRAQLIFRKDPVYPNAARQAHMSGSVELHFLIRADGTVRDVKPIKGSSVLAMAAVEAVQSWRYEPARLNGTPVESEGAAIVDFKD